MSMKECPRCHSTRIAPGWVLSAGKVAFKAEGMPYPFVSGNMRSYVCTECGYLESYVDQAYLMKVRQKNSSPSASTGLSEPAFGDLSAQWLSPVWPMRDR